MFNPHYQGAWKRRSRGVDKLLHQPWGGLFQSHIPRSHIPEREVADGSGCQRGRMPQPGLQLELFPARIDDPMAVKETPDEMFNRLFPAEER